MCTCSTPQLEPLSQHVPRRPEQAYVTRAPATSAEPSFSFDYLVRLSRALLSSPVSPLFVVKQNQRATENESKIQCSDLVSWSPNKASLNRESNHAALIVSSGGGDGGMGGVGGGGDGGGGVNSIVNVSILTGEQSSRPSVP